MHVSLRVTALAAALLVTQQACGSPAATPAASGGASVAASGGLGSAPSDAASSPAKTRSATTTKSTKTSAPAGGSAAFSGDRQFYFFVLDKGVEVPESLLAATSGGQVEVNGDFSGRALFVPSATSPGGKEHLIKTGKLRAGGEALCLKIRNNGSSPLTVVTAACDAGDKTQLFLLDKSGKDSQGRMTYAIRNGDAFLQWNPTGTAGLIAEELGDAKLNTTFVLIDRGKSTVPQLDS